MWVVAGVFLCCWTAAAAAGAASCPVGWVERKYFCYYFSHSSEKQGQAVKTCKNMSASLASIHSFDENTFVMNRSGAARHTYWLGMQKSSENNNGSLEWRRKDWHWYDGTKLDFVNWGELQPNRIDVLCAVIRNVTQLWDDVSCDTLHKFICKTGGPTETAPSTASTISNTSAPSSLGQSLRNPGNTVTSTSTSSLLAATTSASWRQEVGKRGKELDLVLYAGVGIAFIVIVVVALVITIIMCRRRNSMSNNSGTMPKSSIQADGDFLFVQNNVASPQQVNEANQSPNKQGNIQQHQYDNINMNDLRTFRNSAHNLDGESNAGTPSPGTVLDFKQQTTQMTLAAANTNQNVNVVYAKPTKRHNRSNAPTLESLSTDSRNMAYQEHCLHHNETMGDDMFVLENNIYG